MRFLLLQFTVISLVVFSSSAFGREWADATGKYKINAELVAVRGGNVILEKKDGTIATVPIAKLSQQDQDFLKEQTSKPTVAPATDVSTPTDLENVSEESLELANNAQVLLDRYCFRCHGQNQTNEGGFGFALDREKLVSSGYVIPRNSHNSLLMERLNSTDAPMPPEAENPRPTQKEIELLKAWIDAGAPSVGKKRTRSFISTQQVFEAIAADLKKTEKLDRPYVRYFSVVHLANYGISDDEIGTYKKALAKLINSLSWNRQLANLRPVASLPFLFRIDLRDLKWTKESWQQIIARYPHGLVFDSREAYNTRTVTGCDIPVVRADWFVAAASRPPLYHELAQIPATDLQLETLLQVSVKENIENGRALRVGFARSGVSQNNRLIERHQSIFGAYWKSYDFAGNTGQKNLFEHPMGPSQSNSSFVHDGGEIIFHLPNGLLAFMLTDASGNRIDRGPVSIVSDPRQPDRTVVNGVSCMSCHYGGLIKKTDEVRKHVLANEEVYSEIDLVKRLYPEPDAIEKWFVDDSKHFLNTLSKEEIEISKPTQTSEPIVLISNRYRDEVDLPMAASELGLPVSSLESELKKISLPELTRSVGALQVKSGVIKRDTFDQTFQQLAIELGLGVKSVAAASDVASRSATIQRNTQPMSAVANSAMQSLKAGTESLKRQKWQDAEEHFTTALKLSNDKLLTARIYEQAIPLYERGESIDRLLEAHLHLLDLANNSTAIKQSRQNFYASLQNFANKTPSWSPRSFGRESSNQKIDLPASVASAVLTAFEEKLTASPNHEPSLQVMELFWQRVQNNPSKRKDVLLRLRDIYKKRNERLEPLLNMELAEMLTSEGQFVSGAEIYAEVADQIVGPQAASFRIREGEAWRKGQQPDKALAALKKAQKELSRSREDYMSMYFIELGDAYLALDNVDLAETTYRAALKNEKNGTIILQVQKKLEAAKAVHRQTGPKQMASSNDPDDVLDPRLPYKLDAQRLEQDAKRNDSTTLHSLSSAAENWIKAEEPKRAEAALRKAVKLFKLQKDNSSDHDRTKLAQMFSSLDLYQDAVNLYCDALKTADSDYTIQQLQNSIAACIAQDSTVQIAPEFKDLVDPMYPIRMKARSAESRASDSSDYMARSLLEATKIWVKTGDLREIERIGMKVETAIKNSPRSDKSYEMESLSKELANLYSSVNLHEGAIRGLSTCDRSLYTRRECSELLSADKANLRGAIDTNPNS